MSNTSSVLITTLAAVQICLSAAIPLEASVYYVAQGGADANAGIDSTAPWLHCPGMPGWSGEVRLAAGDTVYFRNSDTWEATSGTAMVQVAGGVVYDGRSWGSGGRATLKAQTAFDRAIFNCMEDDETFPTVIRGFNVDANGYVTSGITFNWPHAGRNLTGAVKKVEDCEVQNVWSESAHDQYEYGILMGGWGGYQIANFEILNCLVHDISRGGINNYMGNDMPENRSDNVTIRGNEIYATGRDPNYAGSGLAVKNHTVNTLVEYNYIHDAVNGMGIGLSVHPEEGFIGPENTIIRHNIVSNIPHCGMYLGSPGEKSFDIYGNIFMQCDYEAIRISAQMAGSNRIRIYNNTFFHNFPGEWSQQMRVESSSAHFEMLEVKNNIFYCPPGSSTRALLDDIGSITAHSNNLYFHPDGGTLVICNGSNYTQQTIEDWEPEAFTAEPGFKDTSMLPNGFSGVYGNDMAPNPDGLSLQVHGDAVDNGADLGEDFCGAINFSGGYNDNNRRPHGHGWDIGAYETLTETNARIIYGQKALQVHKPKHHISPDVLYTINGRVYRKLSSGSKMSTGGKRKQLHLSPTAQILIKDDVGDRKSRR
ncbi:MAG: right-handed parallel beta-helix repeat-containing protein [Fibrobacterota bacterium]